MVVTIDTALQRYLRHHKAEGSTAKTLQWHTDSIGHFVRFLQAHDHTTTLDDLTTDAALDWIEDQQARGLAQKTIQTRAVSLKAFSAWLADEDGGDYLPRDPLRKLKRPKVDDVPKATLAPTDVDALLRACNRHSWYGCRNAAIMLLLFSTGLRDSELRGLQLADVDWEQGLVLIRRGKGGKFRVVPLGAKVARALDKYLAHPKRPDSPYVFVSRDGGPLSYTGLRSILRRQGAKIAVPANQHKWRHTAAIQYLRNGGRVEVLQAMLGHTKIDMTLKYARIAGVDVTEAHELADPARSLKTRV